VWAAWIEADPNSLPIERLDPATRASVLMALLALSLLWLLVIAMIVLGARWARNYGESPPRASNPKPKKSVPDPDDWARKPLVPTKDDDPAPEDAP
jgi:hypothetical protein